MKKFLLHITLLLSLIVSPIVETLSAAEVNSINSFYQNYLQSTFGVKEVFLAPPGDAPVFDNLVSEATICYGDTHTFDATVTNIEIVSYSWNVVGEESAELQIGDAGEYVITVTDNAGNQTKKTVKLNVIKIDVQLGADKVLCEKDSYKIISSGVQYKGSIISYQWSDSNGVIVGETKNTLSVSKTDTYTVLVTYDDGNVVVCYGQDEVKISFPEKIEVDLGDDTTVCTGEIFTLNIPDDVIAVTWRRDGFIVGNGSTLTLDPINFSDEGIYEAQVTSLGGCDYFGEMKLTVVGKPNFVIAETKELCGNIADLEVILGSNPADQKYTYQWYDQNGNPVAGNNSKHKATAAGIYTAVVTADGVCDHTETVEIYPAVENFAIDLNTPSPVCEGTEIILDATLYTTDVNGNKVEVPNAQYVWTKDGASFTGDKSAILKLNNKNESGSYEVTITTNSTCTYTDVVDIEIIPNPVFNLEADKVLCGGSATIDLASFTQEAGITYTYELVDESNNVISTTVPPYNVSTAGNYTLNITANGLCTNSDNINIYQEQVLSIIATNNNACEGYGGVTLNANLVPSNALNVDWVWYDPANNPIGYSSFYVVNDVFANSGTYKVVAKVNGCEYTETIDVTINETIDATIPDADICGGIDVQVPVTINNFLVGETYTYTLSYGGTEIETKIDNADTNPVYFTIDKAGSYSVTISTDKHCPVSVNFEVGNPLVDISVTGYPICEGDKDAHWLTAIVANNSSSIVSYEWKRNGIHYGNGKTITPELAGDSGDYTVTVTFDNGCVLTSGSETIKIYEEPSFNLPDVVLCGFGSTVVIAPENLTPPDDGTYIYTWVASNGSGGTGVIPPGMEDDSFIEVSEPGKYTLTITTPGGCSYTAQAVDVIREYLKFTPVGFVCSKEKLHTLHAVVYGGYEIENPILKNGIKFVWTRDSFWQEDEDDSRVIGTEKFLPITENGTYYVVAYSNKGCRLEYEGEIGMLIDDFTAEIITDGPECVADDETFTLTATGNNIPATAWYYWYKDGTLVQEGPENTYLATGPGAYTVSITPTNDPDIICDSNAATVVIGGKNDIPLGGPYAQCGGTVEIGQNLKPVIGVNNIKYTWYRRISENPDVYEEVQASSPKATYIASESGYYKLEAYGYLTRQFL